MLEKEPNGVTTQASHFLSDGTEYRGEVFESRDGRFLFGEMDVPCAACNGSGRGMRGPCPRCKGARTVFEQVKVYDEAGLSRLQKQQDKRRLSKQSAEIERQEAVALGHQDYVAAHKDIFERAVAERSNDFLQDLVAKSQQYGGLTDAQTRAMGNAIAKIDAERALYASSRPIGIEGDEIDREFECMRVFTTRRPNFQRTGMEDVHVHELRDDDGNAAIVFGRRSLAAEGDRIAVRATVARFDDRRGYSCTILGSAKVEPAPSKAMTP